jgi:hypothetical protein
MGVSVQAIVGRLPRSQAQVLPLFSGIEKPTGIRFCGIDELAFVMDRAYATSPDRAILAK